MKLYWCPNTRAVRVVWMLEEIGVDYERVLIDIRDEARPPDADFLAASPMGKVPALADGDLLLADSAAICLYAADRYAPGELAPAIDDPRRGRFLYWMFYTPGVIEPALAEKFSGAQGNRFSNGWGDFDAMMETFVVGLGEGPWMLGESFTAADVMLGSSAVFMRTFGLPLPDALSSYADRCLERPAYQRAGSYDDAGS